MPSWGLRIDDLGLTMNSRSFHDILNGILETKNLDDLKELFEVQDLHSFIEKHKLNFPVKDLLLAFTHKSFSHEFNVPHQEQLEFLGDAVLQLILTEELYRRFPEEKEGRLSKLRSALVNEKSLALMATGLGLDSFILVGRGEFKKRLFEQAVVLADTFEALLAQIYRFHGLEFTRELLLGWIDEFIPSAFDENFLDDFDAKSKLQEKVLAKYKKLPRYSSENHGDQFEVTLWINDEVAASGIFSSKKAGEKELAQETLKKGNI